MECLRTSKRVLGTTHQDTARVMNDIGHMRIFQGRFKEAESMFTGAYITYKLLYGEDSPLTQIQLSSLGVAYSYSGREQSAEKAFLDSIESLNRTVGSGAPEVAAAYSNLADLYLRQKRFTAAEYYYLEAYETRCKSYTQFDEGSLRALYKVGFAAQCQGDKMDIARKLYEKCIEVSLLFHGPQSNVTLDCEARLKEVNAILGISREYDHVSIMQRQLAAHQQYNSAMESSFDDYLTGLVE
ncbi:hypothetical protein HDU99_006733 [Rhizoclosmatium hyalinum]|nr:hypothetical protein HDU99_006733 [Rhizoclosmatium hyalinum]